MSDRRERNFDGYLLESRPTDRRIPNRGLSPTQPTEPAAVEYCECLMPLGSKTCHHCKKPVAQPSAALEVCPWCQQPPKVTHIKDSPTNPILVGCDNPKCPLGWILNLTPEEWNRRTRTPAPTTSDASEMGKDLRRMVNEWRTTAAGWQLKADRKGVSRHINTEAQALEIEYGLTKKAEGYRLCATALENMLNWHGIEEMDCHELPSPTASEPATCEWKEDCDGVWHTACGEAWQFTEDGPSGNRCRFCFYCGGHLVEVKYVEKFVEDDDE